MIRKEYYPSGALRAEIEMEAGRLHGLRKFYYESGLIESEFFFWNGLMDGICKWYSENGDFTGEFTMKRGTGVVKKWNQQGALESEGQFVGGELFGEVNLFNVQGKKLSTSYWAKGKKMSKKKYDDLVKSYRMA